MPDKPKERKNPKPKIQTALKMKNQSSTITKRTKTDIPELNPAVKAHLKTQITKVSTLKKKAKCHSKSPSKRLTNCHRPRSRRSRTKKYTDNSKSNHNFQFSKKKYIKITMISYKSIIPPFHSPFSLLPSFLTIPHP